MIFGDVVNLFRELFTTLFRQRWNGNAYELAVVRRVETEIRGANRFLDRANLSLIPGLYGEHLRFWGMHRRHLAERRHRAVVINHHRVEQADGGATGADGRELAPEVVDNGFHSWPRFLDYVLFTHLANSAELIS